KPFKMVESHFNKYKEDKLRVLLALKIKELIQPQVHSAKETTISAWFEEKLMLVEAYEAGHILDEEQLLFIVDTDLMANLLSCDSDVLSKVPYFDTYLNDMINQDVLEMSYSEQTHIDDFLDTEITSDSNIILYSYYLQESQDSSIQDTNSSTPNYLLVLSLVE
nr:hypothetical protein [Tanacetum cinerariifolium]